MGVRQRTLAGDWARAWAVPGYVRGWLLAVAGPVMRAAGRQPASAEAGGSCGGAVG